MLHELIRRENVATLLDNLEARRQVDVLDRGQGSACSAVWFQEVWQLWQIDVLDWGQGSAGRAVWFQEVWQFRKIDVLNRSRK